MTTSRTLKYFLPAAVILTALIYLSGLKGAFIYDDYDQIVNKPELHNIFKLHDVIFCGLRQNRLWQNLILALSWTISPGQTWSFKLFSLMLHLINGSLLFLWLKKLFADKPYLPILTTALFLIHPLQIQSVTYVMGVTTLVQAFFYLLALYWYSKYSLTRMPSLILILIASLFAKETCVLIPLVLLAYEILINNATIRSLPKAKWAILFAIPFLYIPLYAVLKDPVSMYAGTTGFNLYPFWQYVSVQFYFQFFYLILFSNPTLQSIIHGNPTFDHLQMLGSILGALVILGGLIFVLLKNKKASKASFFILFFFITYLPTNNFFQMINPFAEYRLYLSNISLCLLLVYGIHKFSIWLSQKTRFSQTHIVIPVAIFFSIFTFQNVMIWRDGVKILTQSVKRYPMNDQIYQALGEEYLRVNDLKNAFFYFYESRFFSGWLNEKLARNYYLVAGYYYKQEKYLNAWEIIEQMYKDKGKDPLPAEFFTFHNQLETKMKSLGISTENHWSNEGDGVENRIRLRNMNNQIKKNES